jgi:anthranilate synthase/aminodeoxychorismate synthase-like glutamine amidotransferase
MAPRILLLDNFDSFAFNVAHGLVAAGGTVEVARVDAASLAGVAAFAPDLLVLGPGPGRPEDASLCLDALRTFAGRFPIFGICLGMQCLAVAFGGRVGPAPEPVHGKVSRIRHDGAGLFEGLGTPLEVGRYHSLAVLEVPPGFQVSAWTEDGGPAVPMAMRHTGLPLGAVQFHPDSFLTGAGPALWKQVLHGRF